MAKHNNPRSNRELEAAYVMSELSNQPSATNGPSQNISAKLPPKKRKLQDEDRSSLEIKEKFDTIKTSDEDGDYPLHIACSQGNVQVVSTICDVLRKVPKGSDLLNALNKDKQTPIILATTLNEYETVRLLLKEGADCSLRDTKGRNVVHIAVKYKAIKCLELICDKKHNEDIWNVTDYEGLTPLHYAVLGGDSKIVDLLIKSKVRIDAPDGKSGLSALSYAVDRDQKGICSALVSNGADIHQQCFYGMTPIQIANNNGYRELASTLASQPIDGSIKKATGLNKQDAHFNP
ncbi:DgyrCDS4758 [Dimorphilus gyrociliatus]|nr:DgyrCDS4758 [Dimorphilus gyrociliatus]